MVGASPPGACHALFVSNHYKAFQVYTLSDSGNECPYSAIAPYSAVHILLSSRRITR